MGARDLLDRLLADGFTLDAADGTLLVTPASRLTDALRVALRASKPDLLALVAEALPRPARTGPVAVACTGCQHFGRYGTCLQPVAAGLLTEAEGFGIVWPGPTHAASCPSFNSAKNSEATT
jgi:hypothetical protein